MSALKFYLRREPMLDELGLYIRTRSSPFSDEPPANLAARPIEFEKPKDAEFGVWRPPTLSMRMEDAQQLIDELWQVGLRPTEGSGSAGALAATQRHLKDLQHLVFKTKPKE